MRIRQIVILVFLAMSAIACIMRAYAQDDTIELPGNIPAIITNGSASYYDPYGSEKALHLTIHLYNSEFDQEEKSSMVAKWLQENGLKNVTESKDHLTIDADTDVQTVMKMFGITIDEYSDGTTILYYSNSKSPQIPVVLNGIIKKIDGLDNFPPEMR